MCIGNIIRHGHCPGAETQLSARQIEAFLSLNLGSREITFHKKCHGNQLGKAQRRQNAQILISALCAAQEYSRAVGLGLASAESDV